MILFLIPAVSLALLILWAWLCCRVLKEANDLLWLGLLVFAPPLGFLAYLINFFILGDEERGLTYLKRISGRRSRLRMLSEEQRKSWIPGRAEEVASILLEEGRTAEALEEIKHLLDSDPESVSYQYLAAKALAAIGNAPHAMAHLDYVVSENPLYDNQAAAILYTQLLQQAGKSDGAIAVARRSLYERKHPELLVLLIEELCATGAASEAAAAANDLPDLLSQMRNRKKATALQQRAKKALGVRR